MKRTRILLILSMVTILVGSFVYASISQDTLIAEQVKVLPKPFDLENPDGLTVQVKLNRDDVPVVDQIDPSTVRLDGFIVPLSTEVVTAPPNFNALFDGSAVAAWVLTKISHLELTTPNPQVPIKVSLKISGQLYDGTPWEGFGDIKVYLPVPSDPPPPPPP